MIPSIPELIDQKPVSYAAWCGLGSSFVVELVAAAGWDLVLIDQQHGFGGQQELLGALTAARAGGVPAAVRVAWNDPALISRALDGGAGAVVCPMINTPDDARAFVAASKYPPLGDRSWGPYRAQLLVEGNMLELGNRWAPAIAQIETAQAIDNLDEILAVEGLDGVLVGPNDLAISMIGSRDICDKRVRSAISEVAKRAAAADKLRWIFANDSDFARTVAGDGWQIMTIGTDMGWLSTAAASALPERSS